jgi:hypothetical protein
MEIGNQIKELVAVGALQNLVHTVPQGWNWGSSYGEFWWIFPLVGLAIMVVMVFACLGMMGGRSGFCCMGGHGGPRASETEDLHQKVWELREETK